jgi:hypothetical protein
MIRLLYIFLLIPALCFAGPFSNYYRSMTTSSVTTYLSDNFDSSTNPSDGFWDSESDASNNLSISASVYQGVKSLHLAHDATTDAQVTEDSMGYTGTIVLTFHFRLDEKTSLGNGAQMIIAEVSESDNSDYLKLVVNADGSGNLDTLEIELIDDADATDNYEYDCSGWSVDTWYEIEVELFTGSGADGFAKLYTEGSLRGSVTGKDTSDKEFDQLDFGNTFSNMTTTTLDMYFDTVSISDGRL